MESFSKNLVERSNNCFFSLSLYRLLYIPNLERPCRTKLHLGNSNYLLTIEISKYLPVSLIEKSQYELGESFVCLFIYLFFIYLHFKKGKECSASVKIDPIMNPDFNGFPLSFH